MALSSHELYLILRARNEATGVLRSFSQQIGQMDREIVAYQIKGIQQVRAASAKQAAEQIRDLKAVRTAKLEDIASTKDQVAAIKQQQTLENAFYTKRIADIRASGIANDRNVQSQIAQVNQVRAAASLAAKEQIADLNRVMAAQRGDVDATMKRIAAIKELDDASARSAAQQIADIRAIEREDLLQAQKAKAAAQTRMTHGTSLVTTGIGAAAIGGVTLAGLLSMTKAAQEYNQQAALTLTQTDHLGISLEQIKDIGRSVAKQFPVDFQQVQGSLYDIFSSIDTNAPGAKKLLEGIAEAAVAGGAPMQTTGRAIISIMNAYHLSADKVNNVNDVMFQLVRKGVGTYQQFTNVIGRSIPSATRAGQSFQTLAGMMAFMTRNGMSAANASVSAARALDALSNPKTTANFKQFGLTIYNAHGQMKPMIEIIDEMRTKLAGMSQEARSAALADMFKGSGGTIQAMRFFNSAMNDSSGLLQEMIDSMNHAGGAAAQAYAIMANTPQAQVQLLNNRWQTTKTIIGDQLIPVKMRLLKVLGDLLNMFNNLSPKVQHFIVQAALFAAGFLIVGGVLTSVIGVFVLLSGVLEAAEISFGAFIGLTGGVGLALAALVVGVLWVKDHWSQFKDDVTKIWNAIYKDAIQPFMDGWNRLEPALIKGAQEIKAALVDFFSFVMREVKNSPQVFKGIHSAIVAFVAVAVPLIKMAWSTIVSTIKSAVTVLKPILALIITLFKALADIWNSLPADAHNAIIAITLLAVAINKLTILSGVKALLANLIPDVALARVATLSAGLSSLATTAMSIGKLAIIPAIIGQAAPTGKSGGQKAAGWLESIGGGAAAGALAGAPLEGIGAVPGAIIGGLVGAASHAFKVISSLGKSTAQALTPVDKALQDIGSAATQLGDAVVAASGKINSDVKQTAVNLLVQSNTAGAFAQAGVKHLGDVTAAVLGNASAYNTLISTLDQAHATGQISDAQYKLLTGTITSLSEQVMLAKGNLVLMGKDGFGGATTTAAQAAAQIQQLNAYVHALPGDASITITANTAPAIAAIQSLFSALSIFGFDPTGRLQAGLVKAITGGFPGQLQAAAGGTSGSAVSPSIGGGGGAAGSLPSDSGSSSGSTAKAKANPMVAIRDYAQQVIQKVATSGVGQTTVNSMNNLIVKLKKQSGMGGIAGLLSKENSQLNSEIKKRNTVAAQLTAANDALAKAETQYNDFKASVFNNVMGTFDIGSLTGYSAGDMIVTLQQDVANAKEFYGDLSKLKAEGFSPALLAQLAQAGPSQLATAQALMNITPGQVSQINSLYGQLTDTATSLSTQAADEMYGAGVAAAKGLVAGLQAQEAAIQKEMNKIGAAMVNAIKKALGIKSPSTVFRGIGINTMTGLHLGLRHGYQPIPGTLSHMANDMANRASQKPMRPSRGYGGRGGGDIYFGPGSVVTQEINPIKHAADLGWELSRRVG